ncbi:putative amidoligase enzyme-domain-containing protein [Cercophora samala]|uniref:Amidoligase enzyme-domain-containing protein n=1 Tax=Cercophora samala TaxID=330535 RepID=A0AA39Z7Z9_9PEZI|nr:putative amidoligase enzyme-domain-containing protein [Cercophora samala]
MLSTLDFGVEIELLVSPHPNAQPAFTKTLAANGWNSRVEGQIRPGLSTDVMELQRLQGRNRKAIRAAVAAALSARGIATHETSGRAQDFRFWTVVDEVSVGELPGYWRLELVSRVLSADENWQEELGRLFATLKESCKIRVTNDCSMHIHVSPGPGLPTFDDSQIRAICKAICYFDDAITRVMPADRKETTWAKSNVLPEHPVKHDTDWAKRGQSVNPKIKRYYSQVSTQGFGPLWKLFDNITWRGAHACMSYTDGDRARYLSWNFENLVKQCGTLEFRRPPAVDSAEKAGHWIAFTLGFISRAVSADWVAVESKKRGGEVADLRAHVVQGLRTFPSNCSDAFILGKAVEDTSKPIRLSAEELLRMENLKKHKAKTASPFAEKASSRPSTPTGSASNSPAVGRSNFGGWGRR